MHVQTAGAKGMEVGTRRLRVRQFLCLCESKCKYMASKCPCKSQVQLSGEAAAFTRIKVAARTVAAASGSSYEDVLEQAWNALTEADFQSLAATLPEHLLVGFDSWTTKQKVAHHLTSCANNLK